MDRLGRYQIRSEIGRGGFGVVYRAFDPAVGRHVALKVLTAQGDPTVAIRFRAEATTVGSLQHKNIVTVFESGDQDGIPYLVMEYLEGSDLQQIIRVGAPLTTFEKIEIMVGVAEGLQYAHEHGVIHRDIKPANIMRLTDGSVKIMDFGIARVTRESSTRLTQTGFMVGSVNYMSPEQFRGLQLDELCDIWAFGVVFYEILTGQNPFAGADSATVIYKITMQNPPPVQTLAPECPVAIAAMATRLLNKNREERYQTMEDVVFELKEARRDLVDQEVPSLVERIPKLMEAEDFDSAQVVVRRLLGLDPSNTQARHWRDVLRAAVKRRAAKPQIDDLVDRAYVLEKAGELKKAISNIESALRLDPLNSALKSRLDTLEAAQAKAEKVASLLRECRIQFESADLTGALRLANEAVAADPINQEALTMLDQIQSATVARDNEVKLRAGLNRAKGLLLVHSYDEAASVLAALAQTTNSHPEVMERLAEARRLQKEEEARRKNASDLEQAREFLRASDYERACALLEDLNRRTPDDQTVGQQLSYAKDQLASWKKDATLTRIASESRIHRERGDLNQALEVIRQGLELYPSEVRLTREQESLLETQRERKNLVEIEAGMNYARELLVHGLLEQAQADAGALAAKFPTVPAISELQAQIATRIQTRQLQRQQEEETRRQREEEARRQVEAERMRLAALEVERQREIQAQRQREEEAQRLREAEAQRQAEAEAQQQREAQARRQREYEEQLRREAKTQHLSAERMLASGDASGAIKVLTALLAQHPPRPESSELLDRARELEQRQRREAAIRDALKTAREIMSRGDFRQAARLLESELRHYADDAALKEELRQITAAGELEESVASIEAALNRQEIDRAIQLADAAIDRYPGHQRPVSLREQAVNRREMEGMLEETVRYLVAGDFDRAYQLVSDCERRFPQNENVQRVKNRVLAARARQELIRAAQQALHDKRYEEAIRIAEQALTAEQDPAVQSLLQTARKQYTESQRLLGFENARAQASQLERSNRLEEAAAALEALIKQFPEETAVRDDLQRVQESIQSRQSRLASKNLRDQAGLLIAKGNLDEAIALLQPAASNDPDAARDLQSAIEAKKLREQRSAIDAKIAVLEKHFRKGRALEVREGAQELLTTTEEPRARELLIWAQKSIAEATNIRVQGAGGKNRKIPFAIAGVLILTALAYVIWRRTIPTNQIALAPQEIAFQFKNGDPLPKASRVHVHTMIPSTHWSATSSDSRFTVEPAEGSGDSDINIGLNASNLNRTSGGEYTGTVTFVPRGEGSAPSSLRVSLRIEAMVSQVIPVDPVEKEKLARLEKELAERDSLEKERIEKERAEKARADKDRLEKERIEKERAEKERADKDRADTERANREKTERDKAEKDRQEKDRQDREKAAETARREKEKRDKDKQLRPVFKAEAIIDCHADTYFGAPQANMRWTGRLAPGDTLEVGRQRDPQAVTRFVSQIFAGGGEIQGRLPGCPVSIHISTPGLTPLELPNERNGWGLLRFRNTSPLPITSIQIVWTVN
jgi:serine/threonine protein kinase